MNANQIRMAQFSEKELKYFLISFYDSKIKTKSLAFLFIWNISSLYKFIEPALWLWENKEMTKNYDSKTTIN